MTNRNQSTVVPPALSRAAAAMDRLLGSKQWAGSPPPLNEPLPHLSTGIAELDALIGGNPNRNGLVLCAGLPKGRITRLEGNRKELLCMAIAAKVVKDGGRVVYIAQAPHDQIKQMAAVFGVQAQHTKSGDVKQLASDLSHKGLTFMDYSTVEDCLRAVYASALSRVDLVICDSVQPLPQWDAFLPVLRDRIFGTETVVVCYGTAVSVKFAQSLGLTVDSHTVHEGIETLAVEVTGCKVSDAQGRSAPIKIGG